MADVFAGNVAVSGDETARVRVVLSDQEVHVTVEGASIGSWPLSSLSVEPLGSGRFRLSIEGDSVIFLPEDPTSFGAAYAQRAPTATLAERVRAIQAAQGTAAQPVASPAPTTSAGGTWRRLLQSVGSLPLRSRVGVAAGVLGLAAVVAALAVALSPDPPLQLEPGAPLATSPPAASPLGEMTPAELVEQWNLTAHQFDLPLLIRRAAGRASFEADLTPHLRLGVVATEEGEVERFTLTGDPAGDTESDLMVIASWGVAISVANPELDAAGRRAVLERLGIDIDQPQLGSLDADTTEGDISYSIRYLEEFGVVLFTVAPDGG